MLFEYYLEHDTLGILQINEPDGWIDLKLTLERDKNFKSLTERFEGSFIFYGDNGVVNGGIDRILEVERDFGPDATLIFRARVSLDGYTFEDLFEGLLQLYGIIERPDNKIQVPVIPNDFWTRFINRIDTPVDIQSLLSLDDVDVDNFDSINLKLTSQVIQLKSVEEVETDDVNNFTTIANGSYLQIGYSNTILDEIKESYSLPTLENPDLPVPNYEFEFGGLTHFYIEVWSYIFVTDTSAGLDFSYRSVKTFYTDYIDYFLNIDGVEYPFVWQDVVVSPGVPSGFYSGGTVTKFIYTGSHALNAKSLVRFYGRMNAAWSEPAGPPTEEIVFYHNSFLVTDDGAKFSNISVTQESVFPETNAFSFLVHDAAGQICDRIISEDQSFYSEHLGSSSTLYRQYDADGCGWKYAIVKGLQVRRYSLIEKPVSISFNQWWKGINPVLCLGLGYELINGLPVIRVEQMDHFYDDSGTSLDISNVRDITRNYDQDSIFKTVRVGYSKWQSEDISGIDDAQTKHTYATRLQKSGTDLTIESEFIAASLAIETTRRTSRIKSADYKFDNDTFLIAINPNPVVVSPETSPDVNDYVPELDDNFSSIDNLLNAETRYNSRITPARNLMRWIRYVSGCLQSYVDSKFKFVSGEGNYDMTSDMANVSDGCDEIKSELSEKQDIPVYSDPLHLALQYEIRIPLEWEDYLIIRENRKKAIGISQGTTSHVKFFIDTLEYELVKGIATIKAWPVEYFDIQVQEEVPAMRSCIPTVVQTCEDAYLTEDSYEFETEDGNCLILE